MATTRSRRPRRAATPRRRASSPRRPAATTPRPATKPRRPRRSGPDPLTRAALSCFRVVALGAGTVARAPGAQEVPHEHRHDNGGLAAVLVAVVLAAVTWFPEPTQPFVAVDRLVCDIGGGLAWVLPILAAIVAWRLFRHAHRTSRSGQLLSGVAIAYLGALGLAAVADGLPSATRGGLAAVRSAGGLPGWMLTAQLGHWGGIWLSGTIAALLLIGGVRLMIGIPFRDLPTAISALTIPKGARRPGAPVADDADGEADADEIADPEDDDPELSDIDPVDAVPYAAATASDARPQGLADAPKTDTGAPGPAAAAASSPDPADNPTAAPVDSPEDASISEEPPAAAPDPSVLPALSLLGRGTPHRARSKENDAMARELQATLGQYGVDAKVIGYTRGPTITRYELVPGERVRVKKVTDLAPEYKLAAKTGAVRVLDVIEGKSAIGVEIPNKEREVVSLGDILRASIASGNPSPLLLGLGRDVEGQTIVADLARLLHILVAGATGGGKSGLLNDLIVSLLLRNTPEDLSLLLIDPKQVEFGLYRGLPHLWRSIVTDPQEAATALDAVCAEMDHRYSMMASHGVKKIDTYNANVRAGRITGPGGEPLKPLPRLVVVIDELADLMALNKDGVEAAIMRITQVGRAAGIHLISATQRPSVNVVTGVIKANIPTKIALATANQTDSRVIIDQPGAESLAGQGDALFVPAGSNKPIRIQSAWLTDSEIQAVARHWKNWGKQPAVPTPA